LHLDEARVEFSVYPNPTADKLNISIDGKNTQSTIRLIDNFGNILLEKKTQDNAVQISLMPYASGSYTLWIENNNHITVKQIIKK